MKKILLAIGVLMLPLAVVFGQGNVVFANTAQTLIKTNNGAIGNTSGTATYRFGLYIGAVGGDPSSFSLVGVATNGTGIAAGRFSFPVSPFVIGSNNGETIAFQIRGWTLAAGATYEEALINAGGFAGTVLVGTSGIGQVTPATGSNPQIPNLFAANPGSPDYAGQLTSGFTLTPVPEPSSIALGLLGLGAVALIRRRK